MLLVGIVTGVLVSYPAVSKLLQDGDYDCLYLERNTELHFADMPLAHELKRTAWAYTARYAERFLMPEENIEPLIGAEHSRYVVRQDVNLICQVDGECWPMNHCQFELYVPQEAAVTEGRKLDSYQDPMWGDRMARFLSPRNPEDVRHMNERRGRMRYERMDYEVLKDGHWIRQGEMQLIGYRKSISDELDALVVEGDCAWYQHDASKAGRIVLEETRDGASWRHEIELPGSYLDRVAEESALRLWPSVDAHDWWWRDTWWPRDGFEIGYDERFSEQGARSRGEPFWIQDNHVWDYTREFAERFGMSTRPQFLTADNGGLEGAYAMSGQIGCKGLQDGLNGPYTTRHGFRSENLHAELEYVYYCEGGKNPMYEFYLPYSELQAMGVEDMDLAEQMTWMPRNVLRGWRRGESPVELCRHRRFDVWLFGTKIFRQGTFNQWIDRWREKGFQSVFSGEGNLAFDLKLLPGIFTVTYGDGSVNLRSSVRQFEIIHLLEIPEYLRQTSFEEWNTHRIRFLKVLEAIWVESDVWMLGNQDQYLVFALSERFLEKYLLGVSKWNALLARVEAIATNKRQN